MKGTNQLLCSAAALLAMTAGWAMAQQKGRVPPFIVGWPSVELVHFAAIESVQRDLDVSDEVAHKLTALREDYRATYQKACQAADILQTPGPFNPASPLLREIGRKLDEEFIPKLNNLLSSDQQKRFQQIRFQRKLTNRGPDALWEVRSELMLSDDQLKKLNALIADFRQDGARAAGDRPTKDFNERRQKLREEYATKAAELLTTAQKARLEELKGSEFDTSQLVVR